MENLRRLHLVDSLNEAVLGRRSPVLGICLGLQLMANRSEEGGATGLGWFDADVVRFDPADKLKFKVPHFGWNQISIAKDSLLMKGIAPLTEFYFAHSFYLKPKNPGDVLNETEYEHGFASGMEKGNVFGVQYHPEKSHDAGETLLGNFVAI